MFGKRSSAGTSLPDAPPAVGDRAPVAPEKPVAPEAVDSSLADRAPPLTPESVKAAAPPPRPAPVEIPPARTATSGPAVRRSENFYDVKSTVFSALIDTMAANLDEQGKLKPGTIETVLDQVRALATGVRGARVGRAA